MLTTVLRTFNPAEAQLVRSRLEAAGFHPRVMDELAALSIDGYAMAAGGLRVQVPDAESAEARELLALPAIEDDDAGGATSPPEPLAP